MQILKVGIKQILFGTVQWCFSLNSNFTLFDQGMKSSIMIAIIKTLSHTLSAKNDVREMFISRCCCPRSQEAANWKSLFSCSLSNFIACNVAIIAKRQTTKNVPRTGIEPRSSTKMWHHNHATSQAVRERDEKISPN